MSDLLIIIENNKEWLFSGLGVLVLGFILKRKVSSGNNVIQKNIKSNGNVIGRDNNEKHND